eukprot:928052-Amphidinium_carterae.1
MLGALREQTAPGSGHIRIQTAKANSHKAGRTLQAAILTICSPQAAAPEPIRARSNEYVALLCASWW